MFSLRHHVRFCIYLSAYSLILLMARFSATESTRYLFLTWNLWLAWVALGLAVLLTRPFRLPLSRGIRYFIGILWLLFLPNTFYIITDLIHLRTTPGDFAWYDLIMLSSFAWTGIMLGFTGLRLIHSHFQSLYGNSNANWIANTLIVLTSFGVYLGRFLRLNSWDVIKNPGDTLFSTVSGLSRSGEPSWALAFCIVLATFLLIIYWGLFSPQDTDSRD